MSRSVLLPTSTRVVCALAVTLLAAACVFSRDPGGDEGERLFRLENCGICHGETGQGGPNGPTLRDLARHWTAERLVRFLADPDSFRTRDPRLEALSNAASNRMTPFAHLSEERRRRLAEYLLTR